MGDCRIRLLVSRTLLPAEYRDNAGTNTNNSDKNSEWHTVLNKIFSSDSTVREVIEDAQWVLPLLEKQQPAACLWDCTVHPPKDITDWPLHKYCNVKGLNSKTLFDAGWFPSGTLRVSLQSDGVPNAAASSLQYDDHQYNLPSSDQSSNPQQSSSSSSTKVQLVGSQGTAEQPLLPSQVLHSVTQRFEGDDQEASAEAHMEALRQRRQNQTARHQKEQERFQKLEARIRRLDETKNKKSSKKPGVSDQVKRMLIKSRATGAESLKPQDRVYFQIVIDQADADEDKDDDEDSNNSTSTEVFRYFSIQDTVSRILSQFTEPPPKKEPKQSELLVKTTTTTTQPTTSNSSTTGEVVYRRLPGMMRAYEAIEQKYLDPEFNNIVIRWYAPERDEATTSVLEDKEDKLARESATTDPQAMDVDDPNGASTGQTAVVEGAPSNSTGMVTDVSTAIVVDDNLAHRIRTMEEEEQKTSKKKKTTKSSTSTKVRQMLIKGKAKGDGKRIQMVDRFFFELITVVDSSSSSSSQCESSFAYLGRKDPLGRILRDCVKSSLSANKRENDFELLVPMPVGGGKEGQVSNQFHRLDNLSMTFQEAETNKLIQPFERMVVRFHAK